ncbi:retinal dehydrogenase 2-like [Convolutriloba macropyga]|uniref:retinal dehydrogenase 2-like n=1 Tax=Convolutriloba macropyga TaxID=536237 RepID=UPI003F525AB4
MLLKLADLFERDVNYMAELETADCGKLLQDSIGDIKFSAGVIRYYAGWCDKICGQTIPCDGDYFAVTKKQPVGICAAITPWNYPIAMFTLKLAPILACGNVFIGKPAEQTPLTALYIAALCKEVGFPSGVVAVLPGYGPTAGAALANNMEVNKITFTGSTEVGKLIMKASGDSNLKRVTLELGGKSPNIIFADYDNLEYAATVAQEAAMTNMGQCCCAGTRTFVQEDIYDQFVEISKILAESRVVGSPKNDDTQHGPQIDKEQKDKIIDLIESGKKEGAKVVFGGKSMDQAGFWVEPTVFADVEDKMRIAKEEIFGPVQSIFKFKTMEEVVKRANDTQYGLGGAVFTKDVDKAYTVASSIDAGTVWINCYNAGEANTPFGGFKMSGIGREYGEDSLNNYLETKTVILQVPKKIN